MYTVKPYAIHMVNKHTHMVTIKRRYKAPSVLSYSSQERAKRCQRARRPAAPSGTRDARCAPAVPPPPQAPEMHAARSPGAARECDVIRAPRADDREQSLVRATAAGVVSTPALDTTAAAVAMEPCFRSSARGALYTTFSCGSRRSRSGFLAPEGAAGRRDHALPSQN